MKNILIIFLFVSTSVFSQVKFDSINLKNSWYGRVMPIGLYTGQRSYEEKFPQNIEIGKSIGGVDVGLAYGRINQRISNSNFIEARATIVMTQVGPFSNEYTLGVGHIFSQKTPVLLEIATTIFAQIGDNWGYGIMVGNYDISGSSYGINKNYFALFVRVGLLRSAGGILYKRKVQMRIF